jgi:hypothetical protein
MAEHLRIRSGLDHHLLTPKRESKASLKHA